MGRSFVFVRWFRLGGWAAVLSSVALLAACGGGDSTATPTATQQSTGQQSAFDKLVEEAKAEVAADSDVYVRLSGLKDQTLIATEEVLEREFGIKVTLVNDPKGFSEVPIAYIAEHDAGTQDLPILFHNTSGNGMRIGDANGLADIDWVGTFGEEWPVIKDFNQAVEVPRIRGGCLAKHWLTYILIYNTNAFSEADAPRNWKELTDPKFSGKVAAFSTGSPVSYLTFLWGEEETVAFAKALKANGVIFSESGSPGISAMVAGGEALVSTVNVSFAQQQVEKGAPVNWALAEDGLFYLNENICVPKNASHPKLGALIAALWTAAPESMAASIRDSEGFTYAYPFASRGVLLEAMTERGLSPDDFINVGNEEQINEEAGVRTRIAKEAFETLR